MGKGKHADAIAVLTLLVERHPDRGAVWGSLGKAYFEAGDFPAAAEAFGRTTVLSPSSELASLGLFHSLWKTGAGAAALVEMKRFLSVAPSAEYATLLCDLVVEGAISPRLAPAKAA